MRLRLLAGIVDGACSVRLVSRVFVRLMGCVEPGSRELGKVANIYALFVAACIFEAPEFLVKRKCKVEAFFRPFVPNKQDHW